MFLSPQGYNNPGGDSVAAAIFAFHLSYHYKTRGCIIGLLWIILLTYNNLSAGITSLN